MAQLPSDLTATLEHLESDNWRERKEAVATIVHRAAEQEAGVRDALVEALLDRLVETDVVHARAAAHEALVGLELELAPRILARLDPNHADRARLLVELLSEVGGSVDTSALVDMVRDGEADPNLRAASAAALGTLGGSGATEALIALLEEDSEMLRIYALDALRASAVEVPVDRIAPLLEQPITRKGAAALLGRAGAGQAIPLLLPLLNDPMAGVRAVAVVAVARIDAALRDAGHENVVRDALTSASDQVRANLRELIGHRETQVSTAAMTLSTLARDVEALPLVLLVMDNPDAVELALHMVMEFGEAANGALAAVAIGVEAGHRANLCRLAGALRVEVVDPALQTLLTEALDDGSEETACAAAEALRFVGARSSLGALYRTMGQDGHLGELAADALARIVARLGGARHDDLNLLVGASWPQQGALARNLCRVVGALGASGYAPHLVSMMGSTDSEVRVAAASALGQLPGEHEGVGALSFALADEEAHVRAAACRSLGQLHAPHSVQSLVSATRDPSPLVRAAAVQALVAVGNPVALSRFREIVVEEPVPTVVVQAIAGLGSSGSEQDLGMLMSLCTSSDHEVLKAAARALSGFPAHRATAALLGLLSHERWDVRWAAAEVLAARGDPTALDPLRGILRSETDSLVRQVVENAIAKLTAGGAERE